MFLLSSVPQLIFAISIYFEGMGLFLSTITISWFIGRNLSHKIATERRNDVRKTLRLMGCRDDTYMWGNMAYATLKGLVVYILVFVFFAVTRLCHSDQYRLFEAYSFGSFVHNLIFNIFFFLTTCLFSMTMGQIFKPEHYICDVVSLI